MKKMLFFVLSVSVITLVSCDKYNQAQLDTVKPRWIQYDNRPIITPASPYLSFDYVDNYWSFNTFGYQDDTAMIVIENPNNIPFSVNYPVVTTDTMHSGMSWYSMNWTGVDRQNLTNNGDTLIAVISPGTGFDIGETRTITFEVKWENKLIRNISYTFTRQY